LKLDIQKIRQDFPILSTFVHGKPLIYLDNAATTQKPLSVINAISEMYCTYNSNIHRGVHYLSEKSTEFYENARKTVQTFINAEHSHEIIFTRGTTEAINLVAFSFGDRFVEKDDEIIVSELEHHSNIVPWQMLCERKGAHLKVLPFNEQGELLIEQLEQLITAKTKLIAVNHVSNSLGTINPIEEIISVAHKANVPVLIDAAQSIQHIAEDVQKLDCDFFVFSGHKLYGPTGIGVLYGKEKWLNEIPPYQGGGDMIDKVTFAKTTYNSLPFKFEAGTSDFVGAVGLAAAIDYVNNLGIENIAQQETELLDYVTKRLLELENIRIYGTAKKKTSVASFLIKGIHPYDTGMILDKTGIAVRTGNHCTQPIMDHFGIPGTVRASFSFYNTKEEIDILCTNLIKVIQLFG